MLTVTFERVYGPGIDIHPTPDEVVAVAKELALHGRRELADRLRSIANDHADRIIVVRTDDVPALVRAVEEAGENTSLCDGWAAVRHL